MLVSGLSALDQGYNITPSCKLFISHESESQMSLHTIKLSIGGVGHPLQSGVTARTAVVCTPA